MITIAGPRRRRARWRRKRPKSPAPSPAPAAIPAHRTGFPRSLFSTFAATFSRQVVAGPFIFRLRCQQDATSQYYQKRKKVRTGLGTRPERATTQPPVKRIVPASAYNSLASRYLIALAVTAIATVLQIWLAPVLGGGRYLILIGAMVISATYAGFGPALLSIALSSAAAQYLFDLPPFAPRFVSSVNTIQLTVIDTFMILLSWIIAAHRAETARLRDVRGQDLQEMANRIEAERRRLADIVSSVPGVVWEAHDNPDKDSQHIDYVSEHVTRMLGYTVEEWLATPNFWLTIVHPDDRQAAKNHAHEHFAAGDFRTNSFRWLTKDGRAIWVESHSMVVKDDHGKPTGMRGVTLDMTARRRAEESLRFLARVSEMVMSSLDAHTTLETAADAALPVLGELCVIDVIEGATVRRAAVRHVDPSMQDAV